MKHILFCIGLLFSAIVPMMADRRAPSEQFSTGNSELDSLVIRLNRTENYYSDLGIGKLRFDVLVQGTSACTQSNRCTKLMADILPFHWKKQTYEFEALVQGSYQHPCDLLITPVSVFSNSRHSRKALREVKQTIMPLDGMMLMNDRGSNKVFVPPFSDDGLLQYVFSFNEEIETSDSLITIIHFSPKRKNHTLIEGNAWINRELGIMTRLDFNGLIDFGQVCDTIYYHEKGAPFISRSALSIDYRYGRTRGTNHFDCLYNINHFETLKQIDTQPKKYDLSDIYQIFSTQYHDMPETTLKPETPDTAATASTDNLANENQKRYRQALQRLPAQLVGRSYLNANGTEVRINGPLNPSSIGYDRHNGLTLRQRIRFSRKWDNGRLLELSPEVGYSFGYHQIRYNISGKWRFNPAHRAEFTISSRNKASGFSSKFKNDVDKTIKEHQSRFERDWKNPWKHEMDFDDLGLYFFHHYESRAELSYELCNGLMAYVGAFYNYRTPERHGSRSISDEQFDKLVDDYYADLNPFFRIEYTPQQYYYFDKNYKQYLASYWPTFTFEMAQGIYGLFGSTSNYTRLELDIQQNIPIGANRSLSYHVGSGTFFKQKGEYFINYHYFARSQYPSTWEEKIGGSFSLLNDYWYCSSPIYHQSHFMYESPFLLLNKIPAISKYVIKERIYLSHLLADGKNSYTEFGYGMGNNYFNVGVFGSMVGWKLWDAGVKFTIEFDQHL